MDEKLERLMGRGKEAAGALTDDDALRKEGKTDQASADIKEHAHRLSERAAHKIDQVVDHAKDFTHRRT